MAVTVESTHSRPALPLQPNALIGRVRTAELVQATLLQPECHLLTLLGPGGIGKTRLALAVAENVAEQFRHGVAFVDLTQIGTAADFPALMASQLDVQADDRPPLHRVRAYLAQRQMLLVLDNCEHVLPIALQVAELLQRCSGVTILATSRAPLGTRWEQRLVVSPLELPNLYSLPPPDELRTVPAVELFLQRARARNLRFEADDESLQDIAAICVQLEGIPLAIELAAARTAIFSPAAIRHRLEESLVVLRQPAPDVPARHQSLGATLDWSHDLLSEPERVGFRRLGVFVGGFSQEAAEAIAGTREEETVSILEVLSSLTDKGLVVVEATPAGEPRYRLLDTVQAYALEKLERSGEVNMVRAAHARYHLDLVERESAHVRSAGFAIFTPTPDASNTAGREHAPWPAAPDREYANVRAALVWVEGNDGQLLLRLASALARYWWARADLSEGIHWLAAALDRSPHADPELRSRALGGLGAIYRQRADFARARSLLEEAVALARTVDNRRLLAAHLIDLGSVLGSQRHVPEAAKLFEESAALSRAEDDPWGLAVALLNRGWMCLVARRYQDAKPYISKSNALFRDLGDSRSLAASNYLAAQAHALQGDWQSALPFLDDALRLCRSLNDELMALVIIEFTARGAALAELPGECARLLGAADTLRVRGYARVTDERYFYDEAMEAVKTDLNEETLAAALRQGRQLSFDQALDEAVALVEGAFSARARPVSAPGRAEKGPLSRREQEVLELLAEGQSNREIGRRLGISPETAKFHVAAILKKLGVRTRTEAVRIAGKRDLL